MSEDKISKGKDLNFIKHVAIASIISFVLAVYPIYAYASELQVYSIVCGYAIGFINALAGYKLNNFAFNKPVKMFMVIIFGGMGLRMIFIAITILILLYFAKLDEVSLVASVFFFYIIFVALEINYLHRKQLLSKKTQIA